MDSNLICVKHSSNMTDTGSIDKGTKKNERRMVRRMTVNEEMALPC